jgi:hypothetical protein
MYFNKSFYNRLYIHTYVALVFGEIVGCQGICLCNDRNEIDTGTEMLHDLNVKWLETNHDEKMMMMMTC